MATAPAPAAQAAAAAAVPAPEPDINKGKLSLQARLKKLSLSVTVDTFAMLFMILAETGPSNLSLSWGVYTSATYPLVPQSLFNIYTGIFGTCRIPTTANAFPVCLQWWDDPYYTRIYSRFFLSSMAGLANFAIFVLFFGAIYACFRPGLDGFICMVVTGGLACAAWIPCFSMMTWLHNDLNNFVYPYRSEYFSAGFWMGLVALILSFLSLGIKITAYKKPKTADEIAAMKHMQAEAKRKQQLQAQGLVVVPMAPQQYYAPAPMVVPVGQAPAGYNYQQVGVPMQAQQVVPGAQAVAPPGTYAAPPADAQMYAAPVVPGAEAVAPPGTFAAPPTDVKI